LFSESPKNIDAISGALIAYKLELVSAAIALAKVVFPVPGGPCKLKHLKHQFKMHACTRDAKM
jgi:hypothetical protein